MAISTCTAGVSRRASGWVVVAGVGIYVFNVLTGACVAVPRRDSVSRALLLAEREPHDALAQHWKIHSRRRGGLRNKTRAVIPGSVFASRQ